MRCSRTTSASRGTLSRISVSSVSRLAIISGSVAFLAPDIGIVPLSRCPPTMRIRSMLAPLARPVYRSPIYGPPAGLPAKPNMSEGYHPRRRKLRRKSDAHAVQLGLRRPGRRFSCALAFRLRAARPLLRLAPPQVFPQRRRQPLAAAAGFAWLSCPFSPARVMAAIIAPGTSAPQGEPLPCANGGRYGSFRRVRAAPCRLRASSLP